MSKLLVGESFMEDPPIVRIESEIAVKSGVHLFLKREDLIHKRLSGNKWRKLKYNLLAAKEEKKKTLLTFGGAFSNHIAAVAEAGDLFDFKTIGVIRGEESLPFNATLQKASVKGMQLIFVSRSEYRNKKELLSTLPIDLSETYVIPEGGTNALALKGCREIISHCHFDQRIDYWCTACGTGGTAAGMISALNKNQHLIGFSVLKGDFMENNIQELLDFLGVKHKNWSVNNHFHFGGYAKFDLDLIQFINDFKKDFDIPLDPIYTGKLLFGVFKLIEKGFFKKGSNIMLVHTGGLQGIRGFNDRFGNLIQ